MSNHSTNDTMLSPERAPNGVIGASHDNPSESWTGPGDLEGALIRRTYAHFDVVGVPGDGVEDGIELTRERTHPLPFAWSDERRSPSRVSNVRPAGAAAAAAPAEGPPRPPYATAHSNASALSTSSNDAPRASTGFKPKSLILSPHRTVISIGGLPSPSAQSHATTVSDYMSAGTAGEDSPPQRSQQPSPPQVNITPATPTLDTTRLSLSMTPSPPTENGGPSRNGANGDHAPPSSASTTSEPQSPASPSFFPVGAARSNQQQLENEEEEALLEQRLRSTDRYGFFSNSLSTSSHAKAVVLPSGSEIPDPVHTALERREQARVSRQRERIRIDKWARMLTVSKRDNGGNAMLYTFRNKAGISSTAGTGKSKKLRRRCYKGIPDRWRSAAWLALLERRASEPTVFGGQQPAFSELVARYDRLLGQPSPYDVQIDLDVPRTMSGHVLFHTRYGQGQRALFHVLHAFSLHCPDCGYCQGMGPIAASLLCYFEPSRAYAAMVRLHDAHRLHTIFAPGFPGLVENFYVQEQLIKWLFPSLHAMLDEHYIDSSSYATKWYITLFVNTVPFETQLRMWDIIFLDGQDALVGIALGVLWGIQNRLAIGDEIDFDTEPFVDLPTEEESPAHTTHLGTVSRGASEVGLDSPGQTASRRTNGSSAASSAIEGDGVRNGRPPRRRRERRVQKKSSTVSERLRPKANGKTPPASHLQPSEGGGGGGSRTPSFESVLGALTSYIIPASDSALIHWVSDLMNRADVRARMKAARAEWAVKQKSLNAAK
ncbi:hypothetical protein OC844_004021 [Tilletia horrida]|nr:hypothetical protein OC844_004021 [Tilletia horrida]